MSAADSPSLRDHQAWLGYLQPDGLVVSPAALVDAQVVLDHHGLPALQERFAAFVDEEGAVADFATFAREFLEWPDDCLFAPGHGERPLPPELTVALPELGETLAPAFAFHDPRAKDPAQPWLLLVSLLPTSTDLDALPAANDSRAGWIASASRRFERLLRETRVPIGLLSNGSHFRLLYAPRGENTGHVTFPVAAMREVAGRPILGAFHLLLDRYRLLAAPSEARLPALLARSRQYQGRVSATLAAQVLDALYELLRGFAAADGLVSGDLLRDPVARRPNEVYDSLLTVLLRFVFLLFAEDRGLLPQSGLYGGNYSVHGLFERLRADAERYPDTMDQRFGAWTGLLALFRAAHGGCRHPEMAMPARRGHLFDPARFPFLEGHEGKPPLLADGVVFRVLERLLLLDGERLSYRTLDVEQIGSVYQTMIGFGLEVARGVSIALRPAKAHGAPVFVDLDALLATEPGKRAETLQRLTDHKLTGAPANALKAAASVPDLLAALEKKVARRASPGPLPPGSLLLQPTDERRRSGSHYTPRALTAPIVRKTLEPILARFGGQPTPQQILDLKVCDPAVGSGAFLVEACRQLGDALVAAWAAHGGKPVIPPDEDELLHARRLVAQRCLYGVDRNPMATDLAKLSLWLATLARDHPFTFLDHSLRAGDALVGLDREQIIAFNWDLSERRGAALPFDRAELAGAIARAASYRREILEGGDHMTPALKAQRLSLADEALGKIRRAGDLCLAAFFDGDKPKARAAHRERYLDALLEAGKGFQPEKIQAVEGLVARLRQGAPHPVTPFHWEIEFPEVFARENGGFDAFIGNPPFYNGRAVSVTFGEAYRDFLLNAYEGSSASADLVALFFRRTFDLLRSRCCLGLIATKTISKGDTRSTGLRWICTHGGTIYSATKRFKWPGTAAVVVSVICIVKGAAVSCDLDGVPVEIITAFLFTHGGHDDPIPLIANAGTSFNGCAVNGVGFTFDDREPRASSVAEMHRLIHTNPKNAERIFPFLGGDELNNHPRHEHHRWIIYFGSISLEEASAWPDLLQIAEAKVRQERSTKSRDVASWPYWQLWRPRPDLMAAIGGLGRMLTVSFVSEHLGFAWLPTDRIVSHNVGVFAKDKDAFFCILQSRVHESFATQLSSGLEDRQGYRPSDGFEPFAFPENWETDTVLEAAGREYYDARGALMIEHNEGLTKTYNRFHDPAEHAPGIHRLRRLHAALDHAVLAAYGWSDLVETGRCECEFLPDYYDEPEQEGGDPIPKSIRHRWPDATRDEVLARLLKLNAERAEQERLAGGVRTAKAKATTLAKKRSPKPKGPLEPELPTFHPPTERPLPTGPRVSAGAPLPDAMALVVALLSEAGGSLPWSRLLHAYTVATNPAQMRRCATPEDAALVATWDAGTGAKVQPRLLIPSLNELGGRNLTVTDEDGERGFHLLDGPRPAATEHLGYDAWLALRVAAQLPPAEFEVPEREAWTEAANRMVFA